tara:strand:+ start:99 stop:626 length:528 start_codon:yes stop_codon:yes gene_type:complete
LSKKCACIFICICSNKGNSLAEFAVTMAIMATLATTSAPAFSRIGEGAKAKQTKANLDKIISSAQMWYNQQVELNGMGRFPSQPHRTTSVGNIVDYNNNRRIEVEELEGAEFISVWSDTTFLHLFDNDTIKSPYQEGGYEYAIIGGSGTGNMIVSPIFVVIDVEQPEDFYKYFKP